MAIELAAHGKSELKQAISPDSGAKSEPDGLAQVCGQAAEHMAKARVALDSESFDTNRALDHLDEAISCLQGLSRRTASAPAQDGNTVVAFLPAKDRRSA
jgi:hypothetical protein